MPLTALAMSALLETAQPFLDRRVRICMTGSSETPLPASLAPSALLDVGTGHLRLDSPTVDVVTSAQRYLRDIAVLPIDREIEALVDSDMRSRVAGLAAKRALVRRR